MAITKKASHVKKAGTSAGPKASRKDKHADYRMKIELAVASGHITKGISNEGIGKFILKEYGLDRKDGAVKFQANKALNSAKEDGIITQVKQHFYMDTEQRELLQQRLKAYESATESEEGEEAEKVQKKEKRAPLSAENAAKVVAFAYQHKYRSDIKVACDAAQIDATEKQIYDIVKKHIGKTSGERKVKKWYGLDVDDCKIPIFATRLELRAILLAHKPDGVLNDYAKDLAVESDATGSVKEIGFYLMLKDGKGPFKVDKPQIGSPYRELYRYAYTEGWVDVLKAQKIAEGVDPVRGLEVWEQKSGKTKMVESAGLMVREEVQLSTS